MRNLSAFVVKAMVQGLEIAKSGVYGALFVTERGLDLIS
jgi:hypothetical protein